MAELTSEENDLLCPAERLLLLGINPFIPIKCKKRRAMNIDEDEYNDDFDDEPGNVDEEPYEDYNSDEEGYIHDDDEYDLAKLKDYPFLRAVILYNNNKRRYYA